VDYGPYTDDLDLASVNTRRELAALLRTVHLRADSPSTRRLEVQTRHDDTRLSKTTVSEMLNGVRFPRKAVMAAFLRACGVHDDHMAPWLRTWERIAVREHDSVQRDAIGIAPADQAPAVTGAERIEQVSRPPALDDNRFRAHAASGDLPAGQQPVIAAAAGAQAAHNPVASRRELGVLLRTLRQEKGLKVEQAAAHLMCSVGKVRRMEASFRAGTPQDVRDLCDLYAVTGNAERDRLMKLAEEGRQEGWWQPYGLNYDTYVGLESKAVTISGFQSSVVHGLLQTAEYARAGHKGAVPLLSSVQIEKQIEAKLTRQQILTRDNPPRLSVILDEAPLHRMFGGRRIMAAQLAKILEMSARPNIRVQVIPFEFGAHPGVESNFTVLDLPSPTPGIVYVEGLMGVLYLEEEEDLERFHDIFGKLQSIALSPQESVDLITDLSRFYEVS
jgi:transcriptional regulator with XRE-family HTH domain